MVVEVERQVVVDSDRRERVGWRPGLDAEQVGEETAPAGQTKAAVLRRNAGAALNARQPQRAGMPPAPRRIGRSACSVRVLSVTPIAWLAVCAGAQDRMAGWMPVWCSVPSMPSFATAGPLGGARVGLSMNCAWPGRRSVHRLTGLGRTSWLPAAMRAGCPAGWPSRPGGPWRRRVCAVWETSSVSGRGDPFAAGAVADPNTPHAPVWP